MRLVDSVYSDDGRPAKLIEIESPADFDEIMETIVRTNYYGGNYHQRMSGQREGALISHFWAVAEMVRMLQPRFVLDAGCGRGDVLRVLKETAGVDVVGVEYSEDAVGATWPSISSDLVTGDLTAVLPRWAAPQSRQPDVLCGFDIWEHIHPAMLGSAIQAFADAGADDALYVAVLPGYGIDRVFGEQHPFPYEINRPEFEAHKPWRYLYADPEAPSIPYAGHLTWADTEWWEQQFREAGLVRQIALERRLHAFDELLPPSVRSFFVLAREGGPGTQRAEVLASRGRRPFQQAAFAVRTAVAPYRWHIYFDNFERRAVAAWWVSEVLMHLPVSLRDRLLRKVEAKLEKHRLYAGPLKA